MITTLIILLVAFQLKHFVADYPLQTKFMLGKFKENGWEGPLLAHVAVHAVMTFAIVLWFGIATDGPRVVSTALWAGTFDAMFHFAMDRVKASPKLLGRFKPLTADTYLAATPKQIKSNMFFWWALGFDQLVHHLTHYAIIGWLLYHIPK